MKDGFVCLALVSAHSPLVDYNKRFLKMVHIGQMFDDGGG